MECADVADVSNEERNDDLQYRAVGNTVAVQAGVQHGQDGRRQQEPDSEVQVEQSQSQPSVRSVMVASGVSAGLTPLVGTRRHQRSLLGGLHL